MHLKILMSMFWSHHFFCCKTSFLFIFFLGGRGVKPCMHLKEFLCQCFGPSMPPSPVSDWHGRAQARAVAWTLVVGGLDLYYRALGGLTTTSDASRDALQKASDRPTIKQAGSLPPIQNNKTKKKAPDIDLSCWDRSIRSNIVFDSLNI